MALTKDMRDMAEDLDAQFEAEDKEIEAGEDVDASQRDIKGFEGFSGSPVAPREIDGKTYEDSLD